MEFNSEQKESIDQMIIKCNHDLNRKENKMCNIARITEVERWVNLSEVNNCEIFSEYEISTHGRIKSLKFGKEKFLKPNQNKKGYLHIMLCANGKKKKFRLNRLVAAAFCENDNPELNTEVNHINHLKNDNFYKNLSWCSRVENQKLFFEYDVDKVAIRNKRISEATKGKKLSVETRIKIREANIGKIKSAETCRRISESNTGKVKSDETRAKISIAKKGKPAHNKGKSMSEESRMKMSIAAKARWSKKAS